MNLAEKKDFGAKKTSGENSPAICIHGLVKRYRLYRRPSDRLKEALFPWVKVNAGDHYALKGLDLEIPRGETLGLIGKNGSGKSTLLKLITGVLTPTSGEVIVDGRISALLELGAGFNMEYTGIENVYLNGLMLGFSHQEVDERLEDILSFADIGDYVHQPVKTYSSGMFVRLAFALAINIEPEILIVDEALSVGDVFFQAKCYRKFEDFKAQGKTILFVSHDLGSIAKYSDRVALLNEGELLELGDPKTVIDAYKQVLVGLDPVEAPAPGEVHTLDYGDGSARIERVYLRDRHGEMVSSIFQGEEFSIIMEVEILSDLPSPIFAFTIKNVQGTELCGTNTMVEKAFLEPVKKGDRLEISFTQRLDLQGGSYLISFGVTGFSDEVFQVYHRLYDALELTCVSDKHTVGVYDMNSRIEVQRGGAND